MKRYIFGAASLLCALVVVADASVKWLSTVHDFGAFDEDTKQMTANFRFVNTGDEPLTIISATATCGCTTPKYDKSPIAPGDTSVIEVSYDPTGRPGAFSKQVYVRTTASPERERLIIKGTVIGNAETVQARFPVSAGALKLRNGAAMVGRVYSDGAKLAYVDGYNQSTDTLMPVITGVPEYIDAEVSPRQVPPGELVSMNFYFRGDRCTEWGIVTDTVMIAPNPGEPAIEFPIVAIVEEDFSKLSPEQMLSAPKIEISEERVVLPPIANGETKVVTAKVKITNAGTDPLKLRRVYSADPGLSVSVDKTEIKKGKSATLTIKYNPSVQPTGIVNCKVNIISNDPENHTIALRVVAERE